MDKLVKNGYDAMRPVCKLFTPDAQCTWLITGIDKNGLLCGYADLGFGCVEWGSLFTIEQIQKLRGKLGLPVERDKWFKDDPSVDYFEKTTLKGI